MPSLAEFLFCFNTKADFVKALELYFWTNPEFHYYPYGPLTIHPVCPFCRKKKVTKMKLDLLPKRYQCNTRGCRRQFNVLTRTPVQGTKVDLEIWFEAYWYYRYYYKRENRIPRLLGLSKRDAANLHSKITRLDALYGDDFILVARRQLRRLKIWSKPWSKRGIARMDCEHIPRRMR